MPVGYSEFEFDLPGALRTELIHQFDSVDAGLLLPEVVREVADVQGVYQLFHGDELVYVGKTDAEAGLRTRLMRHAKKILHRPTLTGSVRFKAIRIMVFTAMDLETQLIKHYKAVHGSVLWNGSGFGANDPGRKREKTNRRPEGFDDSHPINIDIVGEFVAPGETTVDAAVFALKLSLPYTLRYETLRDARGRAMRTQPHLEMRVAVVEIPPPPQTVRDLMGVIQRALGPNWQATVFASHLILYKESETYDYGTII
ncbi:MAG TPA: hypothetical protein DCR74_13960 [Achromobacter sp.]|nr:hypothetical protein [Achromobacter sp.]